MHSRPHWPGALADHRASAHAFAARVEGVPVSEWRLPRGAGKWSPAEESLHVRQVYDVLIDALHGGPGLRSRVPEWKAELIQLLALPLFLAAGRLPRGVRAPRAVAPDPVEACAAGPAERADELRRRAMEFEDALVAADGEGRTIALRHPYFGRLNGVKALRFVALHTRHHLRQFPPLYRS